MSSSDAAPSPISDDDTRALIGILGIIDARLMAGELDDELVVHLTQRLVNAGLLPAGTPSPGLLLRALEDLGQRLRHSRGEYDEAPSPATGPTLHDLDFATLEEARACLERLPAGPLREPQIRSVHGHWRVGACYPELPPDEDFQQREAALREIAAELGGHYRGSQGAPPAPDGVRSTRGDQPEGTG